MSMSSHMSTLTRKSPLSSLASVPLTDETRQRLLIVPGITETSIADLSEMGGQGLLALHVDVVSEDDDHHPGCFRVEYDAESTLCAGCVYQPQCWRSDLSYLHALGGGTVPSPPGVPQVAVTDRVEHASKRRPAPPPSRRATPAVSASMKDDLVALGYDARQITRMMPEVRQTIFDKQIPAGGVSIGKYGSLHMIDKPTRKAPPPPPRKQKRKVPPPPPARRRK